MKVLMISQAAPYLPSYDGFRLMPANFIKELSSRHEIDLVFFSDGSESAEQLKWTRQYCETVKDLRTFQSSTSKFDRISQLLVGNSRNDLSTIIERSNADILHLEGGQLSLLAPILPRQHPILLSVHDSVSLRYKQFQKFARTRSEFITCLKNRAIGFWMEKRWFSRFEELLVTSEIDQQVLRSEVPSSRVSVLPNGVDLDRFVYAPAPVKNRIIFAGNMSWWPNEDAAEFFALNALPGIQKKVPDAQFWIVGASPSKRVRALGDLPGVTVTGTVEDIVQVNRTAHVYVSPLRFGAGVKNKILEAMAIGAPIVATSVSLTGSPLRHEREVLIANSADELVTAILRLLGDSLLCDSLSRNSRALVETEYSWTSICTRLENLYLDVIERHKPQGR